MKTPVATAFTVLVLTACSPPPGQAAAVPSVGGAGSAAAATPAANFELSCHSASTATSRQVHCIRSDTRTGDIQRVTLDKLPVTNGPTASAAGPAGRYHTACEAAASDNQADFYCVRLNTESGEMMMINLTKVPTIP